MKCRLPADAWPATPGRKPCLPSSAWMSLAASATRAGRHADVLDDQRRAGRAQRADAGRACPRARASSISVCSWSRVNSRGLDQLVAREHLAAPPASRASSSASSSARNSTSSAAAVRWQLVPALGRAGHVRARAAISVGATISSIALAPAVDQRAAPARRPRRCPAKSSSAVVVWRPSGTVSNTASATNASVPSEPTSRRRKISSGVSASRNAQRR